MYITCHLAALRPTQVYEFGVASGFSSALILYAAHRLGLLNDGPYLHSYDVDDGRFSNQEVGSMVFRHFPELVQFWRFEKGKMSTDWLASGRANIMSLPSPPLIFIDAGHHHPWPAVDLMIAMHQLSGKGWALLQDVRMMERWIMHGIRYDWQCPPPIRGVEHAFANWPGRKFSGLGIFYNMCTVSLAINRNQFEEFAASLEFYAFECNFALDDFRSLSVRLAEAMNA